MGYYKESDNVYEEDYYVVNDSNDIISYVNGYRRILKNPIVIFNNENINFNFENYILYEYNYVISTENNIKDNEKKVELEKNDGLLEKEGSIKKSPYPQIKIKIEFGDDTSEILDKPLTYKNKETWNQVTHHYEFKDEKFFEETNEKDSLDKDIEAIFGKSYKSKIIITINNVINIKDTIVIPFDIEKSSSSINGRKMDLISANLTNNNNISFTFNIVNDKQIVFATNKKNS